MHVTSVVTVTALLVLVAAAAPGLAAAPTTSDFTITSVRCPVSTDDVTGELHLSHSSTGEGAPGGDVVLWATGADPTNDPPLLSGYSPTIERHGDVLVGTITPSGTGGGQGLEVDDVAYEVVLRVTDRTTSEQVRGPVTDSFLTTNQRFRLDRARSEVVAEGVLDVPRLGAIEVRCTGEEVVEHTVVTSPAALVARGELPMSATCEIPSPGRRVLLDLVGGELTVVVWEGPVGSPSFGTGAADVGRRHVTATVPLLTVDGGAGGVAVVDLTARTTQRTTQGWVDDDGTVTSTTIEHVALDGTVAVGGRTDRVVGCDGVRGAVRSRSDGSAAVGGDVREGPSATARALAPGGR